jgi:hypothetical protein
VSPCLSLFEDDPHLVCHNVRPLFEVVPGESHEGPRVHCTLSISLAIFCHLLKGGMPAP